MRKLLLIVMLAMPAAPVFADGFVLGAGRWACKDVVGIYENGSPVQQGQLAGWLLGFWTAATFRRDDSFVDTVEAAGGRKIYDASVAECRKAPPETMLYRVAERMIRNTN